MPATMETRKSTMIAITTIFLVEDFILYGYYSAFEFSFLDSEHKILGFYNIARSSIKVNEQVRPKEKLH